MVALARRRAAAVVAVCKAASASVGAAAAVHRSAAAGLSQSESDFKSVRLRPPTRPHADFSGLPRDQRLTHSEAGDLSGLLVPVRCSTGGSGLSGLPQDPYVSVRGCDPGSAHVFQSLPGHVHRVIRRGSHVESRSRHIQCRTGLSAWELATAGLSCRTYLPPASQAGPQLSELAAGRQGQNRARTTSTISSTASKSNNNSTLCSCPALLPPAPCSWKLLASCHRSSLFWTSALGRTPGQPQTLSQCQGVLAVFAGPAGADTSAAARFGSMAGSMAGRPWEPLEACHVLFCGDEFPAAFDFTNELLEKEPRVTAEWCPREDVPQRIRSAHVVVPRMTRLTSDILSGADNLRLVVQYGVGLEGVDIGAATALGIRVARIPSINTGNAVSCAEHCIYLLLGLLRHPRAMDTAVRSGKLGQPVGHALQHSTVVIVGYGAIGRELAVRLRPFDVRLIGLRRSWNNTRLHNESSSSSATTSTSTSSSSSLTSSNGNSCSNGASSTSSFEATGSKDSDVVKGTRRRLPSVYTEEARVLDEWGGMDELRDVLPQADAVVVCSQLSSETEHLVDSQFLHSMKKGALLVNIARGRLLDYAAVTAALDSGHLGGLAIDVAWHEPINPADPILQRDNVIVTPHIGGVTHLSYRRMAQIVRDAVIQVRDGQPLEAVEVVNLTDLNK